MRFHFLLCVFSSFWRSTTSDDCPALLSTGISLGYVNGKCLAVTKSATKGTSTTACKSVNSKSLYDIASIDNLAENEQIQNGLQTADAQNAYIGLTLGDKWSWSNNDPSTFRNWKNPPTTEQPTPAATTTPARTTLPPTEQRPSMAVVIGVDASIFSTNTLTFAQVEFARRLSRYVGDRGYAEFALFPYGCTQLNPFTMMYPNFVNTFDATDAMLLNLNETINHDCTKTNPLDFKTMLRDQSLYYNRYSTSVRPFKSKFISMIYFSSSTDSDNIQSTSALWPIPNSTVITINVGSASINIAPYSIPSGKKGLRVQTADDIIGLVPTVDAMMFSITGVEQHYQEEQIQEKEHIEHTSNLISDASSLTDCAYMNSTDGMWYSDGSCTTQRQFVCQYIPPTPAPPPTPNPTIEWSDPCFHDTTNFTYFGSLKNDKCYQLSTVKKQFAEAENACLYNHTLFLHKPDLSSIESPDEENQLRTLTTGIPNEGMFWFGLKRNSSDSSWFFVNGDPFDESSHTNWRPGYPRDADGCDCVALVMNDNSWVNTDCNKQLYSICAYRYGAA